MGRLSASPSALNDIRAADLPLLSGWYRDGPVWSAVDNGFADRRLLGGLRGTGPYFASSPSSRTVALKGSGGALRQDFFLPAGAVAEGSAEIFCCSAHVASRYLTEGIGATRLPVN
jgi:hypothetical protein